MSFSELLLQANKEEYCFSIAFIKGSSSPSRGPCPRGPRALYGSPALRMLYPAALSSWHRLPAQTSDLRVWGEALPPLPITAVTLIA